MQKILQLVACGTSFAAWRASTASLEKPGIVSAEMRGTIAARTIEVFILSCLRIVLLWAIKNGVESYRIE
jgi:hypothetical protein